MRNTFKWGMLRIELAAHYGVHSNTANRQMKVEQVGGIVAAAEAELIGDQGQAAV